MSGWIAVTISDHVAERHQEKNVRFFLAGAKKFNLLEKKREDAKRLEPYQISEVKLHVILSKMVV